ncbi:hypothetical protein [uncultured Erythrobacter sp.]|uniref:hypothetical protein n=1 Tax=uncultured Erythrobacter sp. TaxID=263913 RepID=UPI0026174A75|nr:hypothetical protein [uncultured Erythrobacter sp.]
MIVVIEGISAAGKTTYARQFGEGRWVPEIPVKGDLPDASASLDEHAHFWVEHNVRKFQMALEIEREHGIAVCDTDPMKIHYSWCMARAGFPWPDKFANARVFVREAIASSRLGFADLYLVKRIEPSVARAQKEGDPTRRRENFEQHLALQPHLIRWFGAMSEVFPGRIRWDFPEKETLLAELKNKAPEENPRRFDVSAFDALLERLPE